MQCANIVSPSKFQIESRLCGACLQHSPLAEEVAVALTPKASVESSIFREYSDLIASVNLTESEMVCTHDELLPMVLGYKAYPDGKDRETV